MDLLLSWRSSRGKNTTCTHSLGTEGESPVDHRHQSLTSAGHPPKVPRLKWSFTSGIRISCMWSKVECMKFGFVPPPLTHTHSHAQTYAYKQTSIHHMHPCTITPPLSCAYPYCGFLQQATSSPYFTQIIVTSNSSLISINITSKNLMQNVV